MKRIALAMLFVALTACTLAPVPPSSDAAFGAAQAVVAGNALHFPDGLWLQLERIDDSRCRRGVQCIWAGELAATLKLHGGLLTQEQSLTLGLQRAHEAAAGAYRVELIDATESSAALRVTRAGS